MIFQKKYGQQSHTYLNNYKSKVQSLETTVTSLNVTINQLNNRVT